MWVRLDSLSMTSLTKVQIITWRHERHRRRRVRTCRDKTSRSVVTVWFLFRDWYCIWDQLTTQFNPIWVRNINFLCSIHYRITKSAYEQKKYFLLRQATWCWNSTKWQYIPNTYISLSIHLSKLYWSHEIDVTDDQLYQYLIQEIHFSQTQIPWTFETKEYDINTSKVKLVPNITLSRQIHFIITSIICNESTKKIVT